MRRTDLSAERQQLLVKCDDHPNCYALDTPPTPRRLPEGEQVAAEITQAMQALERLATATRLLPNLDMVTRTLARREAVQSSQIEGTKTQLHELLEYEATRDADDRLPADALLTERYVEALDHGLHVLRTQARRSALDNDLIKKMHAILMQDAPSRIGAGEYRRAQAWIGTGRIEDAIFVPTPARHVPSRMQELESSMLHYAPNEEEQWQLSIVAQLAIAHAQFETIHPFADGNGRVGRLLLPLILAADGYPPLYLSGVLLLHRRAYYDALADMQLRGDWRPWTTLLCRAVAEACDSSIAIAQDLNALHDQWVFALNDLRSDATAHKLPLFLLGHPVISVNQVASEFGIPFTTANNAIEQLVQRKILSEPAKRRNRVFHASQIIERLERN